MGGVTNGVGSWRSKVYSIQFGSFFSYHVETTLKGISLITLKWFPHNSKKDCQQSGINLKFAQVDIMIKYDGMF